MIAEPFFIHLLVICVFSLEKFPSSLLPVSLGCLFSCYWDVRSPCILHVLTTQQIYSLETISPIPFFLLFLSWSIPLLSFLVCCLSICPLFLSHKIVIPYIHVRIPCVYSMCVSLVCIPWVYAMCVSLVCIVTTDWTQWVIWGWEEEDKKSGMKWSGGLGEAGVL